MDQLKSICKRLANETIGIHLTVFDLDAKSDYELLTLIQTVLGKLDPDSSPKELLARAQCPFETSDRSSLLDILAWLGGNFADLSVSMRTKKLLEVVTDSDLPLSEDLTANQARLQLVFREYLDTTFDPGQMERLKTEYKKLLIYRESLETHLNRASRKSASVTDFPQLFKTVKLMSELTEEKHRLDTYESELGGAIDQLRAGIDHETCIHETIESMDPKSNVEEYLMTQRQAKNILVDQLETEIDAKKTALSRLETLLAKATLSGEEVACLEERMQNVSQAVEKLRRGSIENESAGGEKMSMYYQQLKVSREKIASIESEMKKSQKDLRRSMDRKGRAETEFYHTYGVKYISESELDVLTKAVGDRGAAYKTCKAKLVQMEDERNALQNTVMTLNNELESLGHELKGQADIVPSLDSVTQAVEKVNLKKEVALEELSLVISEMNRKLIEKKSVLGPKLEDMRTRRLKLDELQSEIDRRRSAIENELEPINKAITDQAHDLRRVSEDLNSTELDIRRIDDDVSRIKHLIESSSISELQSQLAMKEREKSLIEKEVRTTDMQNFHEMKRRYDIVISLISSRQSGARSTPVKQVQYGGRETERVFV